MALSPRVSQIWLGWEQRKQFSIQLSNAVKRKRCLPGTPDPNAEVVALSPKTLMATNRFVCDVCKKGFQREQNLQLHRRGHNLPWKLRQRAPDEEPKKKVYVCPERTCVHHDPSRALGDLTGIKKHYSRKHGLKTWQCLSCDKKYAVHSDWKAHSKICRARRFNREYSLCDSKSIADHRFEQGTSLNNKRMRNQFHQPESPALYLPSNEKSVDNYDILAETQEQEQEHRMYENSMTSSSSTTGDIGLQWWPFSQAGTTNSFALDVEANSSTCIPNPSTDAHKTMSITPNDSHSVLKGIPVFNLASFETTPQFESFSHFQLLDSQSLTSFLLS